MLVVTPDVYLSLILLFKFVASDSFRSNVLHSADSTNFELCSKMKKTPISGTDCRKFNYCMLTWSGYVLKELACPPGFLFDPEAQKCSKSYICEDTEKSIYNKNSVKTELEGQIKCTNPGIFAIPGTCKKYFQCRLTIAGLTYEQLECGNELNFDPIKKRCSIYNCEEETKQFICTQQGKFALPYENCSKYILCVKTIKGFLSKIYSCPQGYKFDPIEQRCTDSYICSESSSESVTVATLSTEAEAETIGNTQNLPTEKPKCTKSGKFSLADTKCKRYLLCVKTSTGFKSKEYECPGESVFEPYGQSCSYLYICPESSTEDSKTSDSSENKVSKESNENSTTTTIEVPDSSHDVDTPHRKCLGQGRFSVNGTNCEKFMICVQTSQGLKSLVYSCPSGYYYDPEIKTCTDSYICLESSISSTPENPIEVSATTENTITTSLSMSTEHNGEKTSPSSGFNSTTTDDNSVECVSFGRFPVPRTNCEKFLLCVYTSNGFKSIIYSCPSEYYFDPKAKICSGSYICPETSSSTQTVSSTVSLSTSDESQTATVEVEASSISFSTSDDAQVQTTIVSKTTSIQQYSSTIEDISSTSFSTLDDIINNTSKSTSIPQPSSTKEAFSTTTISNSDDLTTKIAAESTTESVHNHNNSETKCETKGRFPVNGSNCKKYLLCIYTSNGLQAVVYSCPKGYYFDPDVNICSSSFVCNEISSTESEESSTFSTTETVFNNTTSSSENVTTKCKTPGRFPVEGTKCEKFMLCIRTSKGLTSIIYSCPSGSHFDPQIKTCSSMYICLEEVNSTTTPIPSTAITPAYTNATTSEPDKEPTCTSRGRFPIPGTKCRDFLLCISTSNGMVSKEYSCPNNSYFDPEQKMCSNGYNCPEITPNPPTEECEPNVRIIEKIISPPAHLYNVRMARVLQNGKCTTVGRYLVPNTRCKEYMLCRANTDGTLTGVSFTCPTTTVFNQVIQKCTSLFTCPDNLCLLPSIVPNPNYKDCSSYILCEATIVNGMVYYVGNVQFCDPGTYYNPALQACESNYICPTI